MLKPTLYQSQIADATGMSLLEERQENFTVINIQV